MLLAELEVWHTRASTPTRRIALGNLVVPVDPPPGFGGLLLGAVVANNARAVNEDLIPDVHRLVDQVERGQRVVQPRLRHRFQVDRHGLARSLHRLVGRGEEVLLDSDINGTPLVQVLGAVYAVERLRESSRHLVAPVLHKALRWRGPMGTLLMTHLAGTNNASLSSLGDPRAWALDILGFPTGTTRPTKRQITMQFRTKMRGVHPDHGGDTTTASVRMVELAEARRILALDATRRTP
ncbi:MAG: hypothetical protein M3337_00295 [Actinomycetota bacterium]|nr:hypothetical protein [Actinomycetota bacterium]